MIKKLSLLLLLLAPFLCGFARAQSFDLTNGRVPLAPLDGLWRFHTGDNPAWADPKFDDSQWPLLRSTEGWSTQGYKDYSGMAWYRFQVTVPDGLEDVSLYLPQILTCYEVFADGTLIGTYGKMPPNRFPFVGGGRQVYLLPGARQPGRKVEVAIRVWHWPGWAMYYGGGPGYGDGLVGDTKSIDDRILASWRSRFWALASMETVGLLEALAGAGALALFVLRRKEREYLWFSLMMFSSAAGECIWVSQGFWVWNVEFRDFVDNAASTGGSLASVAFYLSLFHPRRSWPIKLAIASVALSMLYQTFASLSGSAFGVWSDALIQSLCNLVLNLWVMVVVFSAARQKSHDARLLAVPIFLSTSVVLFEDVMSTMNRLGWHEEVSMALTSKPFPINYQEAVDALFLLAVFAILILRFTRTRTQEERFATEVEAARSVQQYLIPERIPTTLGLSIESVYRPAREVGGDFFQVLPNAAEQSVLIVIGDVAGHGLEAGMLATLIVGAIRTAAEFTTDPGRILALLNKRLQGRGLATCLALRVEKDGSAALANAGHLPPYLNGQELALEGALPLGAIPGIDFPVLHFKLVEGDALMLMTDGVAEAQDAEGHLFGFDRIAEMLRKGVAAAALVSAAQAFGQEDDITVLTVARSMAATIS